MVGVSILPHVDSGEMTIGKMHLTLFSFEEFSPENFNFSEIACLSVNACKNSKKLNSIKIIDFSFQIFYAGIHYFYDFLIISLFFGLGLFGLVRNPNPNLGSILKKTFLFTELTLAIVLL